MPDTELDSALQSIRAAIGAIQKARAAPGLSPEIQSRLDDAYSSLDDLQDDLLEQDLSDQIEAVKDGTQALSQAVQQIQATSTKVQAVVDAVSTISQVLDAVAKIVSLAATIAP